MQGSRAITASVTNPYPMRSIARRIFLCLLAGFGMPVLAQDLPPLTHVVTGDDTDYTIRQGDSLTAIGARFGLEPKLLARQNGLPATARLHPDQQQHKHQPHNNPTTHNNNNHNNKPQKKQNNNNQNKQKTTNPNGLGK